MCYLRILLFFITRKHAHEVWDAESGFINGSELDFNDISSERSRMYTFQNGRKLRIFRPQYLHVSKSGGHRIYDALGYSHYVQPAQGWSIRWRTAKNQPDIVL